MLHDTKSGQAAATTHESKWQYFTSMAFVNAVMIPRPTVANVPTAEESVLGCTRNLEDGNDSTMFRLMIMTVVNSVKEFPMNAK
jgi:hypothetical protein